MGYFGSMYGSSYGANAPSSSSMMFTPNQYGGFSTTAAGTGAGREAASQLQQMRGMLGGLNPGQSALRALAPYMSMTTTPPDMMQRMQQTLGGFGMGNVLGQASQYAQQLLGGSQGRSTGGGMGGESMQSQSGFGGATQQSNPLDYLTRIFGQYGGGPFGASFGSR
jgi:hypothetical protein